VGGEAVYPEFKFDWKLYSVISGIIYNRVVNAKYLRNTNSYCHQVRLSDPTVHMYVYVCCVRYSRILYSLPK